MPRKPRQLQKNLTAAADQILNAVRNGATTDYQNAVPYATNDAATIRQIGAVLLNNPALMNEFYNGLVNRIGKVIFASDTYWSNPLAWVNKGVMDYGEVIEEIFVDIAKPHQYDIATAEKEWMDIEPANVKAIFHVLNYQKYYKWSISEVETRKAFTNASGVERLTKNIIESAYKASEYDLYLVTRYLMAINLLNGYVTGIKVPEPNTVSNIEDITAVARAIHSNLKILSRNYNTMKVLTSTPSDRIRIFLSSTFDGVMSTKVLANAFNMAEADFIGRKEILPPWRDLDVEELDLIMAGQEGYRHLTQTDLDALDNIVAFVVDEDWFQVYDYYIESHTSPYNGEGLYYNGWYHVQKSLSTSPFHNAIALIGIDQTVVSVTTNITEITLPVNGYIGAIATVNTTGFAPKTVTWASNNTDIATVDESGNIKGISAGSAVITVTSVFDPTKTATINVTVQ